MAHAGAGAHHLDVAGLGAALIAERVLVRDRALADIGDDLHVGVRVRREAGRAAISSSFQTRIAPQPMRADRDNWRRRNGGAHSASRDRRAPSVRKGRMSIMFVSFPAPPGAAE
jgi:hypothetical protein